jgi:hypothetical protein
MPMQPKEGTTIALVAQRVFLRVLHSLYALSMSLDVNSRAIVVLVIEEVGVKEEMERGSNTEREARTYTCSH